MRRKKLKMRMMVRLRMMERLRMKMRMVMSTFVAGRRRSFKPSFSQARDDQIGANEETGREKSKI